MNARDEGALLAFVALQVPNLAEGLRPVGLLDAARDFLRPVDWRGKTPDESDLRGCLVFERDRKATARDGTEIAYSVHGRSGPWIVLVPGFCCPDNFWTYLLPALASRYRVIVYDLRGLGLSGMPRTPGFRARNVSPEDFSIPVQVRDLEAVLDAEQVTDAALIGHSMGGQILMEAFRLIPERITALVMLTAPFESPLRTFYGRDFNTIFQALRLVMKVVPRSFVLVWRSLFLVNPGLAHSFAQLTRALGPHARFDDMATYYRHMAYLDPLVMLTMAESMRSHSGADVLASVDVPTLIVAGCRDTFTPPAVARRMREVIPDAELVTIEGAGHGAVIEEPEKVNAAVLSFLERHLPAE